MVFLQSFYPGLSPKLQSISASLGGQLRFDIDFPATSAGNRYVLLASAAGRGSESIFGMPVPLDFDKLSYAMFYGPPRGFFQTRGKLDANGNATAWFQANPGQLNPYLGMPIWFSAVSSARYFGDSFASVAVLASVIP